MKLALAAPNVWGPALSAKQRRLRGPDWGFAMLRLCHSSGLAAPTEVVYGFCAWLSAAGHDYSPWDRLLPDAMLRDAAMTRQHAVQALADDPFHAARLLLFPICARAQSQQKGITLYAAQGLPQSQGDDEDNFQRDVDQMLSSESPKIENQRSAIALRVFQYLHRGSHARDHWPQSDAEAATLFLGAGALGRTGQRHRQAHPTPQEANTRISHRFQSEGIEGIRHAGPSEDPSAMVPSQLVYPGPVMIEKIANEGFTAYDRPPPLPELHHYVFAVHAIGLRESVALSGARAAFWLAARDIERDLARSPASLCFAWLPAGAQNYRVVHASRPETQAAATRSARAWVQCFPDEGAPFWCGPAAFAGSASAPPPWPTRPTGALADAGINLAPEDEKSLRIHLTALYQDDTQSPGDWQSEWNVDLAAIDADCSEIAEMTLDPDADIALLDGAGPSSTPDSFLQRTAAVRELADQWRMSMRKVIDLGR